MILPTEILKKYNLEKKDLPRCLACYTILSTSILFGITGLLYRYKPFQAIRMNKTFQSKLPWIETWDKRFHLLGPVKFISGRLSDKPKEFSKALVEGLIITKIFYPVITPIELGLTVFCVKKWKEHQEPQEHQEN